MQAAKLAGALAKAVHYTVDEKQRNVLLTEEGYEAAEDVLQVRTNHSSEAITAVVAKWSEKCWAVESADGALRLGYPLTCILPLVAK